MLVFALLSASLLFEAASLLLQARVRFVAVAAALLLHFAAVGTLLTGSRVVAAGALLIVGFFRFVSALRVSRGFIHDAELQRRGVRTLIALSLVSVFIVITRFTISEVLSVLSALSLLGAAALFLSVAISLIKYRNIHDNIDTENPSVSICIPARNETEDLPGCIEAALESKYSKLEILVLDDCSHDKTPEIIKHYAHKGVRFIRGQEPGDKWLAKNAAYDKLLDEAKGEIVLFMGVDVRLAPDAVTGLVAAMGESNMMSVLPRRSSRVEKSFFIQPLRYWWELGLWRFWGSHPPVLSTCWMARTSFLRDNGGLEAYRRTIKPEAQFARAARQSHSYRFLLSTAALGVYSQKSPREQLSTALRIRYPQLRRRPESVFIYAFIVMVIAIMPLPLLFYAIIESDSLIFALSVSSVAMLSVANALVSRTSLMRLWPLALFLSPALAAIDIYIVIRSMFAYENGSVTWKDRNICLPMLQVEHKLPELKKKQI